MQIGMGLNRKSVSLVAGALLVVSGPSVLIAWLKLRQRTLGPVLDANGWAVNGRVKVNLPLGYTLTARAMLPSQSALGLSVRFWVVRSTAIRPNLGR